MKLNDTVYTWMKWFTLVVIPALTTAYVGLSAIWGWPYSDEVAKTSAVICVLLGSLIGISTSEYNKGKNFIKEETKEVEDTVDENE